MEMHPTESRIRLSSALPFHSTQPGEVVGGAAAGAKAVDARALRMKILRSDAMYWYSAAPAAASRFASESAPAAGSASETSVRTPRLFKTSRTLSAIVKSLSLPGLQLFELQLDKRDLRRDVDGHHPADYRPIRLNGRRWHRRTVYRGRGDAEVADDERAVGPDSGGAACLSPEVDAGGDSSRRHAHE